MPCNLDILALKVTYVKVLTLQHLTRPLKQGQNKIEVLGQLGSAKALLRAQLFSPHIYVISGHYRTLGKQEKIKVPMTFHLEDLKKVLVILLFLIFQTFLQIEKCVLLSAGQAQMVQALTLDSEAWVQILPLLFTCHVLAEGPSPLPMPQFPPLQARIIAAPVMEVFARITLVTAMEALRKVLST